MHPLKWRVRGPRECDGRFRAAKGCLRATAGGPEGINDKTRRQFTVKGAVQSTRKNSIFSGRWALRRVLTISLAGLTEYRNMIRSSPGQPDMLT
ncbi:unnamed protein product [Spirodela intermedia]|uniref:Uncharacterized protein n=1 Tax=Spirodela intermedia TaxID=51605 RepID=A0A7I8KHI9_SPIIN|nr:unnamed protein product [Spirodela intermedia]